MKVLNSIVLSLVTVALLLSVTSCKKKDNDPKPDQNELLGTWVATSVVVPTGTASPEGSAWVSSDFTIVFIETTMTASNYPAGGLTPVWPATSGYTLDGNIITRSADDVDMSVTAFNATTLTVTFTLPEGTTTSRVAALDGQYTFTFTKQE